MRFKNIFLIFGIFSIFFFIALSSTLILKQDKETYLSSGSTYSSQPTGTKALYLFLKDMDFQVRRWQVPFEKLNKDLQADQAMVIIDVLGSYQSSCSSKAREKKSLGIPELFNWVRRGNTLILIGQSPYLYSEVLNMDLVLSDKEAPMCRLNYQIDSESETTGVGPILPTIYSRGVDQIQVSLRSRFNCKRPDRIVHFQDASGQIVTSINEGRGKIVLISDSFIAQNQGINKGSNIYLLSNIIFNEAASKIVYFDEFDHGYSTGEGLLSYFRGTSLAWLFLHFLLVGSVYFYSNGRHFAPAKELPKPKRRSASEYVNAMAGIYQKAGVYQLGLSGIYTRYKALWLRYLGFKANLDAEEFSTAIAKKINRDEKETKEIIARCESTLKGKGITKEDALYLSRELEKIRKELEDVGVR